VKDVVILLDLAGNAEESSIELAKDTAKKIIETLADDDYFNVIKVIVKLDLTHVICAVVIISKSCNK